MRSVILQRTETSDEGTFGVLTAGGLSLHTGELPNRNNENDLSCIPAGVYQCALTFSNHFKRALYLVLHTDGRAGVRIHAANLMGDRKKGFISQLLGCIALGERRGLIGNQKAILVSQSALRKFQKEMNNEPFTLEIKDVGISS